MDRTFSLDTPLEDVAKRLATIYKNVTFAHLPMFRWLHVLNDATILAEEIRRNRRQESAERAGKILMRLLNFIGYYLYIYKTPPGQVASSSLPELIATVLRSKSYSDYFGTMELKEGPTRWILAKYPNACAKCGEKPCHCVVEPWVFEERREKPAPFEKYQQKTHQLRKNLQQNEIKLFSIRSVIEFFNSIYRNSYHHQEPWKLAMHLTEELGEATTELSRLELILLARSDDRYSFPTKQVIDHSQSKLEAVIDRIVDDKQRWIIKTRAEEKLKQLHDKIRQGDPWNFLATTVVGEQFKEEIADVFSWLAAVIHALPDKGTDAIATLEEIKNSYVRQRGFARLECPYCHETECTNDCIVAHAVANELKEKAFHQ